MDLSPQAQTIQITVNSLPSNSISVQTSDNFSIPVAVSNTTLARYTLVGAEKVNITVSTPKPNVLTITNVGGPEGKPGHTPVKGVDYNDGGRGLQGIPGNTNVFVQDTQPIVTGPSFWIQTLAGEIQTMWLLTESDNI